MGRFDIVPRFPPPASPRRALWPRSTPEISPGLGAGSGDRLLSPPCPNCQQRTLGHFVEIVLELPDLRPRAVAWIALDGWLPCDDPALDDGRQLAAYRVRPHERKAGEWARAHGGSVMPTSSGPERNEHNMRPLPAVVQCNSCGIYARVDPPPGAVDPGSSSS